MNLVSLACSRLVQESPEDIPPDLVAPVSPSLALKAAAEKERRTAGDALASLTTWVRSIVLMVLEFL